MLVGGLTGLNRPSSISAQASDSNFALFDTCVVLSWDRFWQNIVSKYSSSRMRKHYLISFWNGKKRHLNLFIIVKEVIFGSHISFSKILTFKCCGSCTMVGTAPARNLTVCPVLSKQSAVKWSLQTRDLSAGARSRRQFFTHSAWTSGAVVLFGNLSEYFI